MKEYIERNLVLKEFSKLRWLPIAYCDAVNDCYSVVKSVPVADVVERKYGEWVIKKGRIVCDQCGEMLAVCPNRDQLNDILLELKETEKFCYNCGADMREENKTNG